MATPLIRQLRQNPEIEAMVGVGKRAILEVLQDSPWFDDVVLCRGKSFSERWETVQGVRNANLDAILLLTNSLSTGLQAWMSRVPRRIGYRRFGRRWMLTDSLVDRDNKKRGIFVPTVDSYLALGKVLGCNVDDRRMELHVSPADEARADSLWHDFGWNSRTPTVAINSSGAYGTSKVWPQEKVVALCRRLVDKSPYQVLLNCGPAERESTGQVAALVGSNRVRSLGEIDSIPLGLTKAAFARSAVVVSTDSGPRHMAVALGKRVISLFGSTTPRATQTYNQPETVHYLELACQPCYRRSCPLGHQDCMKKIEVETIFKDIMREIEAICSSGSIKGPLPEVA